MDQQYCQSCTMPLDKEEIMGTELDGSHNHEYCKYCYQNGAFTSPDITMDEMEVIVRSQMEKMHIPQNIIDMSADMLPHLKRWKLPILK